VWSCFLPFQGFEDTKSGRSEYACIPRDGRLKQSASFNRVAADKDYWPVPCVLDPVAPEVLAVPAFAAGVLPVAPVVESGETAPEAGAPAPPFVEAFEPEVAAPAEAPGVPLLVMPVEFSAGAAGVVAAVPVAAFPVVVLSVVLAAPGF
jgi:hypothetical protein